MPGIPELLLILLVVVLIFGASRVPAIAENLAKGIQSFKKGLKDEPEQVTDNPDEQARERPTSKVADKRRQK